MNHLNKSTNKEADPKSRLITTLTGQLFLKWEVYFIYFS